ncbi:MAG TPA: copper amine oxidase N-terminal domain-containing protein [Symbiobacteriaceae bacterium]|jgi:hypothetical protein
MSRRLLRWIALPLLTTLILLTVPSAPPARADNTRAFTVGAQVMSTASDILSAIDPSEETLKRFGTGLGSAVLGISIGEAISDVYNGDITKGLETFSWAVGETVVGLTTMGPFYALGKLVTSGSGWAMEKFYAYMTDDSYTQYKKLRTDTLAPLIENPKRDQFVNWAKSGRGTFDGFWSTLWADKFARDRFIDQYRDEYRSKFSWTERTVGFRLFSVGTKRAQDYFKVMNEVPDQATLKDFVFRRWEAQVVTEGLQEAAGKIQSLQNERNKGIHLVLTGKVLDQDGKALPAGSVGVLSPDGISAFSDLGALTPSALKAAGQFALGGNMAYLSSLNPNTAVTLVVGGAVVSRFTLATLMKSSVPVLKEAGVSFLIIDLGTMQVKPDGTVVKLSVRLNGAPAVQVKVKKLDPRVNQVGDPAAGTLDFDLDAVAGKTVKLLVEVWDSAVSATRDAVVEVAVPSAPGPLPITVDVPVPEVRTAASDDAAIAALKQNNDLLVAGKISRSVYTSARNALVSGHRSLANLADQYDNQINGLVDQELQSLRVQGEYYTAKTDELKAKAAKVADGVQSPVFKLIDSDFLDGRSGRLDQYNQARSQYASMLEQAAKYQQELEGLQEGYNAALATSQQHYELYKDQLRGFDITEFPPETNRFRANAGEIERLLGPFLAQKQNGYLAECDKASKRFAAKTDWLLARSAEMQTRVNAARSRIANAKSAAAPVAAQNKALQEKGLFDLTWGMGNLFETMNGILGEEANLKAGKPANTAWLSSYKARLPEFYAMAAQMLEQMYPILGVKHETSFPADTFEGFMDRMQPWLDFEAQQWDRLAGPRALNEAMVEASSQMAGNGFGLDFALAGDQEWMDLYNAFPQSAQEAMRTEGREFQNSLALALAHIGDPAGDAKMIDKWIEYLKSSGYQLKTVAAKTPGQPAPPEPPAGPVPNDPNIGAGKITFQVGSNIAWVNGKRVEMAAPVPLVNGRAMVPVRLIGEALGASVTWNPEYQEVVYIKGTLFVKLRVGDTLVRVDGANQSKRIFVDPAPQIIEGRTYVPVRVVGEALGASVNWIAETKQIVILMP